MIAHDTKLDNKVIENVNLFNQLNFCKRVLAELFDVHI